MLSHAESKRLYLRYRERARELFQTNCAPTNESPVGDGVIKVSEHANVQMTEFGAFVEAVVWVPKEKLE